ncbi:histidine phosphatase family protein [Enterococcus lactis]|uniref:histidine phosphatase family protein n=1 Tax=Enterococcus lactis TaxID=357441 RepID=UPI0022E07E92|nr:histidine phosphatase family protein [Enterococcus lactis]
MLYVTRHGETTWNAQGLVCGRADVPLTEKGQMQAQALAEKVVDLPVPITKIIHSPLQRARDTAQAVEMDFGDYDGLPSKDENFQKARLAFAVRFPNGESVLDVYARIVPLLKVINAYFHPMPNEGFFTFMVDNTELISYE